MNNLITKQVNFNGAQLMAAQDKDSKKVYVGVRWVCEGIGLSKGQMQAERVKIQDDLILSKGARNLVLPTNGGMQEVLCVDLDFLPLWLAKISITPKMQEEKSEVTDRLLGYQLKVKDVLADAFIRKTKTPAKTNLSSINNAVKIITPFLKQAGISEDIQLLTVKGLYAKADVYLPVDIEADKVYYDTKQIAKRLGMMTKTGNYAFQAVSQIIKQLPISSDEVKEVWETNGSWQGVVKKYGESVIGKIENWLQQNSYPTTIFGGSKNYYVTYSAVA